MAFLQPFIRLFAFILLITSARATYDSSSRANVALYYGQGAYQQGLLRYCQQSSVDIIPLAFMHVFPAQGNGFPGTNFGNQCQGGVYQGPGSNPSANQLQSQCPALVADIPVCQSTYGKKIILSLGGSTATYSLTGASAGIAFADFLWGAFGPYNATWVSLGLPRPFDSANQHVEVDGFDFDIEYSSSDNSAGYIAMINQLRNHFKSATKQYLITGAPQCIVPDANMGTMIAAVKFDIIWVQFYNTPYCSARAWVLANPSYTIPGGEKTSRFAYNDWAKFLVGTASSAAKLYIGLPGSTAAVADPSNYLNPTELSNILGAYYCKPNFGGVMIWEATAADNNAAGPYYTTAKNLLTGYVNNPNLSCRATKPTGGSWVCAVVSSTPFATASSFCTATTPRATASSLKISNTVKSSTLSTTRKTSSTSAVAVSQKPITPDGSCGGSTNYQCRAGYCCSQWGWCGAAALYCGTGCQSGFGSCS